MAGQHGLALFSPVDRRRLIFVRWLVLHRRLTDGESIEEAERWGLLKHHFQDGSGRHILPNGRMWYDPDDHRDRGDESVAVDSGHLW